MLTASALRHSFRSGAARADVLRGVSLGVHGGELTLIAGPSGCGKSTLLAVLSGLLAPCEGSVVALGRNLQHLSRAELDEFRLRHSAFVFQSFNLFPGLTAVEQICAPLAYLGIGRSEALARAERALQAVGLENRTTEKPGVLSGGEQQRVAIARAIAKSPRLLYADEPTSALDSANGKAVTELLRSVARDSGAVVLCVSHDPRVIASADRVLHMQDGAIQSDARSGLRAVAAEQAAS